MAEQSPLFRGFGSAYAPVLVDFARSREYAKRGGGAHQVSLDEAAVTPSGRGADLVALDETLNTLATLDARQSRVVELRFSEEVFTSTAIST